MAGGDSTAVPYNPTFKPSKPNPLLKKSNLYPLIAVLCIISYLLGAYQQNSTTTKTTTATAVTTTCAENPTKTSTTKLDFHSHHNATTATSTHKRRYPPCNAALSDYTPCEDRARSLRFPRDKMVYRERHCPGKKELLKCRVPAPHGYRSPFPWPASRDMAWYANVPYRHLTVEKAVQNWIRYDGDRFRFPGGGTMFPDGADKYIDDIGALINLRDGSVRTAVDTGCGVRMFYFVFVFVFFFIALI